MADKSGLIELFHAGRLFDAYRFLGCIFDENTGVATFRVFAPRAHSVSVIGSFNDWDDCAMPMTRIGENGLWEATLQKASKFDSYKYVIRTGDRVLYKSDPYAFHSETRELTNSKVYDISRFVWHDDEYLKNRENGDVYRSPVNIYEAHIGSWRKNDDGTDYSYRKLADEICTYLKKLSYTHIELVGVAEYPYDYSWGYQVTGYFAPTSRYGTPEDFAYLVDKLHSHGIGVIIDWVPGHFPKNENGLYEFDGHPLYEPSDPLRMEHKGWGTRCFDYGRGEVVSFLISNAMMWFDIYHVDGLRVDAVASILYLDYDREDGEWRPNKYGGNGNLEAMEFFKNLNCAVFARYKNVLMIAEESTSWPMITKPVHMGGLGFNYKWNMGWMNDNLAYLATDPLFRRFEHNKMTFAMTYAFSENFILPISHDEVVYGKRSLLNKMHGNYEQKFAGFRNFLMWMYAHTGKKLLFMGSELASFDEWDVAKQLHWDYLNYDLHASAHEFVSRLNAIYKKYPCFWEIEDSWEGFEWLVVDDRDSNIFCFERRDKAGNVMVCAFNFSPVDKHDYSFFAQKGSYTQILCSDIDGFSVERKSFRTNSKIKNDHNRQLLTIDIKGLGGLYLYKRASTKKTSTKTSTKKTSTKTSTKKTSAKTSTKKTST